MKSEFARRKSDDSNVLGFVPRISIDMRIRCPRLFTEEFPCPEPPTLRYGQLATKAAEGILVAAWQWRRHIEVIKVGYSFDEDSPEYLYLTDEMILVVPTVNEKVSIEARQMVGFRKPTRYEDKWMTFDLNGTNDQYSSSLRELSLSLVRNAKEKLQSKRSRFADEASRLDEFMTLF